MKRPVIYLMTAIFAASVVAPTAVVASSEGRRNTALALTAATVYTAVNHKDTQALAFGAGAAYAWKRYGDSRHREIRRHAFRRGYARGYHRGHRMHNYRNCWARR